jgi:hypothetical protein
MATCNDAGVQAAFESRRYRVFGMALVALVAGCVNNHYELEVTPHGRSLERRIVCWREESQDPQQKTGGIPQEELDRIALAYGLQAPVSSPQKREFKGTFERDTPQDVGGSGSLTEWTTSLGRTSLYVERFRGSDDLAAGLETRRTAADELADALIFWFRAELGEQESYLRVRAFFDETLRKDLHNLAAYAWAATAVEDVVATDAHNFEMLVRAGQFFVERGYLQIDEVPELARAIEQSDHARLVVFLRRVLLTKLGLPKQETAWDFLSDPERVRESLNLHLQQAPGYLRYCEQREPDNRPQPEEYIAELCLRVVGLDLFANTDELKVTVRCPTPPYRTNGAWSDDARAVVWTARIPEFGEASLRALPPLLFAFWSVPDEAFQTAHFGKVVLRDEPLARYSLWRRALTGQEATEWDDFVATLQPGETLPDRLGQFRFSSDPPPTPANESPPSLADAARQLILAGWEEPETR